jgi:hypothetical protein
MQLEKNEKKRKGKNYGKHKAKPKKKVPTSRIQTIATRAPVNVLTGRWGARRSRRRGGARGRVSSF